MIQINKTTQSGYKYLNLLISLMVMLGVVTAIVQNRLVSYWGIDICAAVFVYPIPYVFYDITTEVYGYKIARQLIWCCIIALLISVLLIVGVIHSPTPAFWSSYSEQFNVVMAPYSRTVISGVIAIVAGQFINIYVISKFKILTRGRFFWIRSVSSCLVGDTITTLLALTFIFFGRIEFYKIMQIIAYEVLISIVIQAILAVPAISIVNFLKKSEGIDVYDYGVNFNPFKFSITESSSNIAKDNV